jgi:hypothetical protein
MMKRQTTHKVTTTVASAEGVVKHSAAEDCSMDQPGVVTTRTERLCSYSVTGRVHRQLRKACKQHQHCAADAGNVYFQTSHTCADRALLTSSQAPSKPSKSSRFQPQHAPSDRFLTRSCWALQTLGSPFSRALFDANSAKKERERR